MKKKTLLIVLVIFALADLSARSYTVFEKDSLSVYPNPASEQITLTLKTENSVLPKLRIIDMTGKIVLKLDDQFTEEEGDYKATVDILKLKTGIYFIKVIQGEKAYTEKLVVR